MGVGEMGVCKMGVGEMVVGETGAGEMAPILTYYKPNLMFQTEVPCAWGTSYNKCSADTTLSSCGSERDGMICERINFIVL